MWVVVVAAGVTVALLFGVSLVMDGSSCERAKDDVEDVLRAMALFGEDDAGLQAEYVVRSAERAEACAP